MATFASALVHKLGGKAAWVRAVESPPREAAVLFLRVFGQPIPQSPNHFILEARTGWFTAPAVLGYVHFTPFEDAYLAGGLVVDAWRFRELHPHTQSLIRQRGGMAEWLMTDACASVSPCLAVYAYIGDKKSETVNLRVGFRRTGNSPHLYVFNRDGAASADRLDKRTRTVESLGPF